MVSHKTVRWKSLVIACNAVFVVAVLSHESRYNLWFFLSCYSNWCDELIFLYVRAVYYSHIHYSGEEGAFVQFREGIKEKCWIKSQKRFFCD